MGAWVKVQEKWTAAVEESGSRETKKAKKDGSSSSASAGSSVPMTHALPRICADLGDMSGGTLWCGNYDQLFDPSGQNLGHGSYGQVEKIQIKNDVNTNDAL